MKTKTSQIKVCRVMIEVQSRAQAEEMSQALQDLLFSMQNRYRNTYENTYVLLIDDITWDGEAQS